MLSLREAFLFLKVLKRAYFPPDDGAGRQNINGEVLWGAGAGVSFGVYHGFFNLIDVASGIGVARVGTVERIYSGKVVKVILPLSADGRKVVIANLRPKGDISGIVVLGRSPAGEGIYP